MRWCVPGTATTITCPLDQIVYQAAEIKDGVMVQEAIVCGQSGPIAMLRTQGTDICYLVTCPRPLCGLDLYEAGRNAVSSLHITRQGFKGVIFPMVSLNVQPDVSYLKGLHTIDRMGVPSVLAQVLAQSKLRMNERGARVQDAAAGCVERMCVEFSKPLVITTPFLAIFVREGEELPYFVAYCAMDCWKNPGSLD